MQYSGDDGKRSKVFEWVGDAPTLKTVKRVEKRRRADKKKNAAKNNGIDEILKNLDESPIDKFVAENPKDFGGYNPRKTTLENLQSVLVAFERNTRDEYRDEDGHFISQEKNKETGAWELVDVSEACVVDNRFNQKFRIKWGIEELNPEDNNLSKYCGESPVTIDYIRKVQFVINFFKNPKEETVVLESEVTETPTQSIEITKEIEAAIRKAVREEMRGALDAFEVEYQRQIEYLGKLIEKQTEIGLTFTEILSNINNSMSDSQ